VVEMVPPSSFQFRADVELLRLIELVAITRDPMEVDAEMRVRKMVVGLAVEVPTMDPTREKRRPRLFPSKKAGMDKLWRMVSAVVLVTEAPVEILPRDMTELFMK
jgi:hypothetical protein